MLKDSEKVHATEVENVLKSNESNNSKSYFFIINYVLIMSENDNKKEEALLQDSCQRRKHRCNEFKKKYAILVMVWYTILLNNGYGIQKNITDNAVI